MTILCYPPRTWGYSHCASLLSATSYLINKFIHNTPITEATVVMLQISNCLLRESPQDASNVDKPQALVSSNEEWAAFSSTNYDLERSPKSFWLHACAGHQMHIHQVRAVESSALLPVPAPPLRLSLFTLHNSSQTRMFLWEDPV